MIIMETKKKIAIRMRMVEIVMGRGRRNLET